MSRPVNTRMQQVLQNLRNGDTEVADIPGSLADIGSLVREFEIIGAAAGSLFVFKGVYHAVLINYPPRADKDKLVAEACA
jgi:hypothetical protein